MYTGKWRSFKITYAFTSKLLLHLHVICVFVHMCTPMKACGKARSRQVRGLRFFFFYFVCMVIFVGKQIGGLFIFTFSSLRRDGEDQPGAHHLGADKAQCTWLDAGRLWNFLISHTSSSPVHVPCWIEGASTFYSHEKLPGRTQLY